MNHLPPGASDGEEFQLKARVAYLWHRLNSSLWAVPGSMVAVAIALAVVTLTLDRTVSIPWSGGVAGVFAIGPEGTRLVLSTIAGSMITVASLVFSMTLVTLTLASSQLGPRLIARFMQDRVNQIVLGMFIATFIYALLILQTVTERAADPFVPHISVTVALIMTITSVGWLVYFVHHVARSIQADTVIARVCADLSRALDGMYPQPRMDQPAPWGTGPIPADLLAEEPASVRARADGYVQAIDAQVVLALAHEHDLVIEVDRRPGQFVIAETPVMRAWPRARITDQIDVAISRAVVIGPKRTSTQDIEFAIGALVDIALRALSPGINDPRTAMTCIDQLSAALAALIRIGEMPPQLHDRDGTLRLITNPTTFDGAIDAALDPIRQAAGGNTGVLIRLIQALEALTRVVSSEPQRRALARHGAMIARACATIAEENDRAAADRYLRALDAALSRPDADVNRATAHLAEPGGA